MLGNWKNWCRVCANRDGAGADKLLTLESTANQLKIINNFFLIPLLPLDGRLLTICKDCITFMEKMEIFKDQCLKTEKMFQELIQQEIEGDLYLESVRRKYGFDSTDGEEIKYCNANVDDLQDPLDGAYSDPLELEIEIEVKQEIPEVEPMPPFKEREGRRKSKLIEKIDYGETTITEKFGDELPEVEAMPPLKKRGRPKKPKIIEKIDYSQTTTEDFDVKIPEVEAMPPLKKRGRPKKPEIMEKNDYCETTTTEDIDDKIPEIETMPPLEKSEQPKKPEIMEKFDYSDSEDFDDERPKVEAVPPKRKPEIGKYKRKTGRANICEEKMMAALRDIQEKKITFREASRLYNIPKMTLFNRMKKAKAEMGLFDHQSITLHMGLKNQLKCCKYASRQVFTTAQESILVEYLFTYSKLNYGLPMDAMRELAYQYSVCLARKCPESWEKNERVGKAWAMGFLKRHNELSLKKPENTSLARNTSFNRENLTVYFENLQQIMRQHSFEPSRIWNLGETGLSTVLQAPRVLDAAIAKGANQVEQCVSNKRCEKVSIVGIVNAAGESLPSVYIFPRKRNHPEYMAGSPSGSIALFNAKGYMDSEGFVRTLEHVKLKTTPSKEDPILIVMDNHGSHLSLAAIRVCRESGIHMVTLPPHTSYKTQPLDLTVFGPFKSYCKKAFNAWLIDNPGQRITLHNIARVSASAIDKSFSSKNIKSGFAKSGVYPLDMSIIFGDLEDLGNSVAPISVSPPAVSTDYQEASMNSTFEAHIPSVGIHNSSFMTTLNQLDDETLLDLSDEAPELKKKEEPEVMKGLKREKLEVTKGLKKKNLEVRKDLFPDIKMNQRKRGRPRKIPLSEMPIKKQ